MRTTLRLLTTADTTAVTGEPEAAPAESDAPVLVWVQFPDGSPEELAERTGPQVARIVSVARCTPTRVGDLVAIDDDGDGRFVVRSTLASGGYVAHRFAGRYPGDRNWAVLQRQLTNRGWICWRIDGTSPQRRQIRHSIRDDELVVHLAVPAYVEAYEVDAVLRALTGDWAQPPEWPTLRALAVLPTDDDPDVA